MGRLLVYVETHEGRVRRSSLEVLTHCRSVAHEHGDELVALIASPEADRSADEAARFGASTVYTVRHPALARPLNMPLLAALQAGAEHTSPDLIALPASESVREVLGALAVRLNAAALPDAIRFRRTDGAVEAMRPVFAARFLAHTRAVGSPVLVSLRTGSFESEEAPVPSTVEEVPFSYDEHVAAPVLRDVVTSGGGERDVSEARIVVAAGRGVRDEAGKRLVEELAAVLGAAIGSSRAVVEAGLFPPSTQIGQTGKVVSPDLYVAIGISGAIQHAAGMTGSRVIVAVNKDPDAPIFQYATYGIVGDLYDVVPRLIAELKR